MRAQWLEGRQTELLPVEYFHVVFTVPQEIAAIAYTHRVAISNNRLHEFSNRAVTFAWNDYRHESRNKAMTLDAHEFIRRFLLHVLPSGFQRIRHYGLLANRYREVRLKQCRDLLAAPAPVVASETAIEDYRDRYQRLTCSR